ncbi:Ribosomal_L2_C domain-containing protein [Meloidogyne graminicola]|uniref:Ribosomal_L2_C domain-containing protein n=1 Tax=Meloidogyne graminicola TaxID=189291 RepID=A0A8T0A0F1_9BILA|nr:Ribosomal_L2_C domain-containing protein [Meloidogyne graminicola]
MLKIKGLSPCLNIVATNIFNIYQHKQFLLLPSTLLAFSQRGYPARGTKPKKRLFFDFEHLNEITDGKYTIKPLNVRRMGGRDPATNRKSNIHIGGGVKFDYFMLDLHRRGPTVPNSTYDERVIEVRQDPNRTPHLALVAGSKGKRWIYATQSMKAGQIISSSCYIPKYPTPGVEGNAYPLGALSEGTKVNTVEILPTAKSHVCITEAGSCGEIVRHQEDYTIVRMPNQHEYALKKECIATVGKLSHEDYRSKIYGSPQMHRRFGYRMAGSPKERKDGYSGRKLRRLPPVRVFF